MRVCSEVSMDEEDEVGTEGCAVQLKVTRQARYLTATEEEVNRDEEVASRGALGVLTASGYEVLVCLVGGRYRMVALAGESVTTYEYG